MNIPIESASVKVMRSHDYCHFEICLSTSTGHLPVGVDDVDELRKTAARLADKAVEQYKVAKENIELAMGDKAKLDSIRYRHRDVLEKPEAERTPEEKALVKAIDDRGFRNRPRYNYEDEWQEPSYDVRR